MGADRPKDVLHWSAGLSGEYVVESASAGVDFSLVGF